MSNGEKLGNEALCIGKNLFQHKGARRAALR